MKGVCQSVCLLQVVVQLSCNVLTLGPKGLAGAVSPVTGNFVEAPKVVWVNGKKKRHGCT